MSKSVDTKVVELRLENGEFEPAAKQSISVLEKLKAALKFDSASSGFDDISKAASKVDLSSLERSTQAVGEGFSVLATIATGALYSIGSTVASTAANLVKQFAIAPITSGLSEYQEKMDSIKVTMANTGRPLEDVKKTLEELNVYADKTIYSFGDMTKSLGLFTAQGIGLEDAAQAIQGISNLAAVTGASANDASRAMFNFAQALSAGSMKLVDWKTMMNTGMGNDRFREEVIQVAKDLGYTTKEFAYGNNQTISGMQALAEAEVNFQETLKYGWMDNEVMIEVLRRYADEEFEIGQMASKAATEVNTFAKLMDATGENIQSGWAQVWELIIGDYYESTQLWTAISDNLGNTIGSMFEGITSTLQEWRKNEGRENLLEGLSNSIKLVTSLMAPFKEAFKNVFPAVTGEQLADLSRRFAEFTGSIELSEMASDALQKAWEGVLTVFKLIGTAIGTVVDILSPLAPLVNVLVGAVVNLAGKLGSVVKSFGDFVTGSESFKTFVGSLKSAVEAFTTAIIDLLQGNKSFTEVIKELATALGSNLGTAFNSLLGFVSDFATDFLKLDQVFASAKEKFNDFSLETVVGFIKSAKDAAVSFVENLIEGFNGGQKLEMPEWLTSFLDTIKGAFENFDLGEALNGLKLKMGGVRDAFVDAAEGITPFTTKVTDLTSYLGGTVREVLDWLVAELKTLSFDDVKDAVEVGFLANLSLGLKKFFDSLAGLLDIGDSVNDVLGAVKDTLTAYQSQIKYDNLVKIATAIGILAGSVVALALLDTEKMLIAVAALGVVAAELAAFTKAMTVVAKDVKSFGDLTKMAVSLGAFGLAINTAVGPIKKLGSMDLGALAQGVIAFGVVLAEMVVSMQSLNAIKVDLKGVTSFATAITLLIVPLKLIASMDIESMVQGVVGLGAVITELAVFTKFSGDKDLASVGIGLDLVAVAILALVPAIAALGSLDTETLAQGLIGLGVALTEMGIAVQAMSGDFDGAAAIAAVAASLTLLLVPITALGSMELATLAQGLIAMGVALAEFLAAGAIATTVAPGLTALTAAMAGFSAASVGIAAVMIAAAAAFSLFANALEPFANGLEKLVSSTEKNTTSILSIIQKMISGLLKMIPELKDDIVNAITALVSALVEVLEKTIPDITHGIMVIIDEVLAILKEYGPDIVEGVLQLVIDIINGLADKAPDLVDAAFRLVLALADAFVDAIDKYTPIPLGEFLDAGYELVTGLYNGLKDGLAWIQTKIKGLFDGVVSGVKNFFGINSPSKVFKEIGGYLTEGLADGIKANSKMAEKSAENMGNNVLESLRDTLGVHSASEEGIEIGGYVSEGVGKGIFDGFFKHKDKIAATGKNVLDSLKESLLGENKAAVTETAENVGSDISESVGKGVKANSSKPKAAAKEVGKEVSESLEEGADAEKTAEEIMDEFAEAFTTAYEDFGDVLEDLVTQRAEAIRDIFEEELSQISINRDTSNLEYQLWEAKYGNDASEYEKTIKKIESLKNELYYQQDELLLAKAGWQANVTEFGADSIEAKQAYQSWVKAETELYSIANEITKLQNDFNKSQTEGRQKYLDYVDEQIKLMNEGKSDFQSLTDIYAAAKEKSGYDPDEYWQELTEDVKSIVEKSLEYVDEYYKQESERQLEKINEEFSDMAVEAITALAEGIETQTPEAEEAVDELVKAAIATAEGLYPNWLKVGEKVTTNLGEGIEDKKDFMKFMIEAAIKEAKAAADAKAPNFRSSGEMAATGFAEGVRSQERTVITAVEQLAENAQRILNQRLQIHSPSKVFEKIGNYLVQGLADGLNDRRPVDIATNNLAEAIIQEMENAQNVVDDYSFSPTVTPIVDNSDLRQLRDLGTIRTTLPLSYVQEIAKIARDFDKNVEASKDTETTQSVVNNTYNMTQNNTSPKALSTYDIYRQTRNLFSRVKEASIT